jgi:hypothetical protein
MLPKRRVLFVLLLTAWLVGAAEPPPEKKDPQSTFEPRSKPGVGQKFLEKFVGDWTVEKTFYPQKGDPVRQKGECKQAMMHDGRFLRSEFVFGEGETKTTGLGIIGFEADSGKFTSVWTDSRSTRISFRQSQDKFDGEQIVLHSGSLQEGGKEARRSRTVTRLEDDGRKIVHRQFNSGKDAKERLIMELVLTRKGEAPKPAR